METIEAKDIVEKIKEEICRLHPITTPRSDAENSKYTEMEIELAFFNYEGVRQTGIYFLDGNDRGKSSTSNSYRLKEYIPFGGVKDLIDFLLLEYPILLDISYEHQSFSLRFSYPSEKEEEEGISCSQVILEFRTREKDLMPVVADYLSYIVSTYYKIVSKTPTFQKRYEEYLDSNKREAINGMSYEEITLFISKLTTREIKDMLKGLDSQAFFRVYSSIKGEEVPNEQKKLMRTDEK